MLYGYITIKYCLLHVKKIFTIKLLMKLYKSCKKITNSVNLTSSEIWSTQLMIFNIAYNLFVLSRFAKFKHMLTFWAEASFNCNIDIAIILAIRFQHFLLIKKWYIEIYRGLGIKKMYLHFCRFWDFCIFNIISYPSLTSPQMRVQICSLHRFSGRYYLLIRSFLFFWNRQIRLFNLFYSIIHGLISYANKLCLFLM